MNVLQGMQYVQQQGELGRARGEQNKFRSLTAGALAGDQDAIAQQVALDPQGAQQVQSAGDGQAKRLRGAAKYMESALKSKDPAQIQGAWSAVGPYLGKLTGKEAPPQWDPSYEPGLQQVLAKTAYLDSALSGATPSGFTEIDMKLKAAGYQPGTPEYQEGMRIATGQQGRAATGGFGFEMVEGPDGRKRLQRRNPRTGVAEVYDESTGDFTPIGGGAPLNGGGGVPQTQAPAAGMYQTPQGIVRIGDDLTPEQREAAMADMAQGGTAQNVNLPVRDLAPAQFGAGANPALAVGRSPEEEAAAVARAKGGVELDLLPQTEAIKRDSAIQQVVGIEAGKTQAERTAAAPATIATLQNSLSSIDALLDDPELGTIVGLGSLNPLNKIPGSKARGLAARADQVAGQAFLAAFNQLKGGGAITEREGAAATAAMARLDRSQGEEDYRQALMDLKAAIEPAMQRAQQQARGGQAASAPSAQRAVNPQTGEVLELRNGQWVRAQ